MKNLSYLRWHNKSLQNNIWISEYLFGFSICNNLPLNHQNNTWITLSHKLHIMRNNHYCLALRIKLDNELTQRLLLLMILPNRRLVKDKKLRIPRQDRSKTHTFSFAPPQHER